MKEEDKDLRDVFESLSKETKAKAPSFKTVWQEAQISQQKRIRRFRVLSIAATLLIIVALGTTFLVQKSCNSVRSSEANFALLKWKAPTDVLMDKANFQAINKIFSLPSDQLLEWEINEKELLKY